jgi:hypothetical protein
LADPDAVIPDWIRVLTDEDLAFLRRLLLVSGSLKALAEQYGVSYPTVRGRLDRLIAKVNAVDESAGMDPFERSVRILVADGKLDPGVARELVEAHRTCGKPGGKR